MHHLCCLSHDSVLMPRRYFCHFGSYQSLSFLYIRYPITCIKFLNYFLKIIDQKLYRFKLTHTIYWHFIYDRYIYIYTDLKLHRLYIDMVYMINMFTYQIAREKNSISYFDAGIL